MYLTKIHYYFQISLFYMRMIFLPEYAILLKGQVLTIPQGTRFVKGALFYGSFSSIYGSASADYITGNRPGRGEKNPKND